LPSVGVLASKAAAFGRICELFICNTPTPASAPGLSAAAGARFRVRQIGGSPHRAAQPRFLPPPRKTNWFCPLFTACWRPRSMRDVVMVMVALQMDRM
jgi:hypothetical protein